MYNKHNIYLDNSATSFPKPKEVVDSISQFLTQCSSNPARGVYQSALDASLMQLETRELLKKRYSAKNFKNVIFTCGITHSLNQLIFGSLKEGDHVLISSFEHNSVVRALELNKINYTILDQEDGITIFSSAKEMLCSKTKALIITHASNVFGLIQPIDDAKQFCKDNNIMLFIDSAQSSPIVNLDMEGITAIAFTAHKGFLGPMGIGGFVSDDSDFLLNLRPLIAGGTGSKSAYLSMPKLLPDYLEAGTQNLVGIAGFNASLKYWNNNSVKLIENYKNRISQLIEGLLSINKIEIYGDKDVSKRTGAISFNFKDEDPSHIAMILNDKNIELRVGLHCAPLAHIAMNTYPLGTLRLSPGVFTSSEEIEYTLDILKTL